MSTISERIKILVDRYADGNNSKFAKMVNTSEANVRNYIGGTQPKFDFLQSVAEKFEISCDWLILGYEKSIGNLAEDGGAKYLKIDKRDFDSEKIIRKLEKELAASKSINEYFDKRWNEWQNERDKLLKQIWDLGGDREKFDSAKTG